MHTLHQPKFALKYPLAYLIFTWAVTSYILTLYAQLLVGVLPAGNNYRECLVCGGQILFQGIIISLVAKARKWEYLGNMMTISFSGAVLLLPIILLSRIIGAYAYAYTLYFLFVAGLMFLEHIRRSKILNLGWKLTISWVFYRAIILIIII